MEPGTRLLRRQRLAGAEVGLFDLVAMSFKKVNPTVIVRSKIMAVQAGLGDSSGVTRQALEAHYLAGGNIVPSGDQVWSPDVQKQNEDLLVEFFKSEMTDQYNDGYLDAMAPRLILGRMGDPEELAATMVWLASEAGGYVTGQTIAVDGGITIT